ncbi:MAG: hypothetical protein EOO50_15545 [Flavobacterium sp.]|uniref:LuxR C-terminal-related transcriptional regulator n=1 Tax=Flavobacterium sp. TaxID=239 RepID=UPI0011FAA39F|nr:LuxR C-terminal-related transcriptional regulator [Flavobacterium sp.]RZJ64438.1 MAG: hypothetical protein EOO50_15545 [Flavobacterium sp.]
MELSFYNEAQKVWDNITRDAQPREQSFDLSLHQKLLDIFHVGNYYFYFFDIKNLTFSYISPGTKTVLGFEPEEVTVPLIMSRIHPDDQAVFLNHESAIIEFVKKLPNDKVGKYKMSYDYRIMNKSGHYVRILQQVVAMQFEGNNNLLVTMGVHTDISHLKKSTTSVLSFIGLDGEPSYIDVNVKEVYKETAEVFTKREKEILQYMLQGLQSQEIAKKLFISKHTVDTHRKNILAKTNTKNTIELAMKVVSQGLL